MRVLCICAVGAVVGCTEATPSGREGGPGVMVEDNVCARNPRGSDWWSPNGDYEQSGDFGRSDGEDVIDLWGVSATPTGDILLYDAGATHVSHLTQDLMRVRAFGREGRGPGEFTYQRVSHGNWLTATDSTFIVLSFQGFMEFALSDGFRHNRSTPVPFLPEVRNIALVNDHLLYAMDRIDKMSGRRHLETWQIDSSGRPELMRRDPLPHLPQWNGRYVMGAYVSQADPLWAGGVDCMFLSDGASDWIVRVGGDFNTADTLVLPTREVPKMTIADERRLERLRRAGARIGVVTGSADVVPTARAKWRDLIVDPDGHVWLRPWRPYSMEQEPITAWIVDPASGKVDSMVVPRFPSAFLPNGEFITVDYDNDRGVPFVSKFTLKAHDEDGI